MNNFDYGLEIEIDGIYFNTFRKSVSSSVVLTYIIPPFTTIRGLIANALGLERDDGPYSIQETIKLGISMEKKPEINREMAKLLKLKGDENKHTRIFSSSPYHKEFLFNPHYRIFLTGNKDRIIAVKEGLNNPKRPLYLGQSDDFVDFSVKEPIPISKKISNIVYSAVEGIHPDCIVERIPYKFEKRGWTWEITSKLISIPKKIPIHLTEPQEVTMFGERGVIVY